MYYKYTLQTMICIGTLSACTTPVAHDISQARVWHNENAYALATTGNIPVYSQNGSVAHVPQKTTRVPVVQPVYAQSSNQRAPHSIQKADGLYIPMPNATPIQSVKTQSVAKRSTIQQKNQEDYLPLIMQAENQSSGLVRSVLAKGREMTLYRKEMIGGSCWDYLDAAWSRAGVNRNMRKVVYQSEKNGGVYASSDMLRAGDWIYHINHNYRGGEHSGMFIGWIDQANRIGLTLSYAGENRAEPARYKAYDLSSVYTITRAPN